MFILVDVSEHDLMRKNYSEQIIEIPCLLKCIPVDSLVTQHFFFNLQSYFLEIHIAIYFFIKTRRNIDALVRGLTDLIF